MRRSLEGRQGRRCRPVRRLKPGLPGHRALLAVREGDGCERVGHRRVAEGFRQLALQDPRRYVVVDAWLPTDEVAETIGSAVHGRITGKEVPGR